VVQVAKSDVKFEFKLDSRALNYLQRQFPERLTKARSKAVEAAGMVWSDEAKKITQSENHIKTGLFVNSIGYNSGAPAGGGDTIHELTETANMSKLSIGSAVSYASALEKRYSIMARAKDQSQERMAQVARTQVQKILFGGNGS